MLAPDGVMGLVFRDSVPGNGVQQESSLFSLSCFCATPFVLPCACTMETKDPGNTPHIAPYTPEYNSSVKSHQYSTHSVMPVMVSKSLPYARQVHKRRYHHEDVKYIVGAAPHVEFAGLDGLRKAECVECRAKNENGTFEEVVGHAGLLPCLVEAIDHSTVDDGREAGKASRDEDDDAEVAPLAALKARVQNENGRHCAEDQNL